MHVYTLVPEVAEELCELLIMRRVAWPPSIYAPPLPPVALLP